MIYERPITVIQAVEYEIAASWWAGWIGFGWLQSAVGGHFRRKAERKHRRYMKIVRFAWLRGPAAGTTPTDSKGTSQVQ